MPPILNDIANYGALTVLMAALIYFSFLIIKKLPSKSSDDFSKTMQNISDSLIAHNERASENHKAALAHYATVLHNHEKIMDAIMKLIMSVSIQDKSIEQFHREIADIKCGLSNIREKLVSK